MSLNFQPTLNRQAMKYRKNRVSEPKRKRAGKREVGKMKEEEQEKSEEWRKAMGAIDK